jgi:hypothetical protein
MGREHDRRDFDKKSDHEHRDEEKRHPAPGQPGEQDPRHRQAPGRGQDVSPVYPERRARNDRDDRREEAK